MDRAAKTLATTPAPLSKAFGIWIWMAGVLAAMFITVWMLAERFA